MEWSSESGVVILGEKPAAQLQANQHQQRKHRECAQRVMAESTPLAGKVVLDCRRSANKSGDAGVGQAGKARDQPESDQADGEQADAAMPFEPVPAFPPVSPLV